ncbi:BQ2448_4754 [Microbotryum intermedium]|uniref:BQ2448_4754 protein n=1 Tax=Microbotryum intermedium TaxID=269621 RepID=A0A238FE10_9BASI|nr:BQ2448_4754 [Microbotryum intermedium]
MKLVYLEDWQCIEIAAEVDSWQMLEKDDQGSVSKRRTTPREFDIGQSHCTLAHGGSVTTLQLFRRHFWCPSMPRDVRDYCRSCQELAAIDFVTGFTQVMHPCQLIGQTLVVTDVFSKMVHLIPLPVSATAFDVAESYYDEAYRLHGAQDSIISDTNPKFNGAFWRALHKKIGTSLRMATPDHPGQMAQAKAKSGMCHKRFVFSLTTVREIGFSTYRSGVRDVFGVAISHGRQRLITGARIDQTIQANMHRRSNSAEFREGPKV